MRVEDIILRLIIKKENKLYERRANSSIMVSKINIIEQVKKTKIKKLDVKGKYLP